MAEGRIVERNNRCKQRNESIRVWSNNIACCGRQVDENAYVTKWCFTLVSHFSLVALREWREFCYVMTVWSTNTNSFRHWKWIQVYHFYWMRLMQLKKFVVSSFSAKANVTRVFRRFYWFYLIGYGGFLLRSWIRSTRRIRSAKYPLCRRKLSWAGWES